MKKTMQSVMEFIKKNEMAIKFVGYSVYMIACLVMYMKFLEKLIPETIVDLDDCICADEDDEA